VPAKAVAHRNRYEVAPTNGEDAAARLVPGKSAAEGCERATISGRESERLWMRTWARNPANELALIEELPQPPIRSDEVREAGMEWSDGLEPTKVPSRNEDSVGGV
jgi:hypothetical protein